METFTKCQQTNLCAAWPRASWVHHYLHLIFPWSCSSSPTLWLSTEPQFDSHTLFYLECTKSLSRQGSSGTAKPNWDMGKVTYDGRQCGCDCIKPPGFLNLNSRPRSQSPIDRTKVIPTEFNWLLIKHVIWNVSRLIPNNILLANNISVLAGSFPKTLSPAMSLHLFPVPQLLQRWAWNHSLTQSVSFCIEAICLHGSLGKKGYHTNHWDWDCLAYTTQSCLWCMNLNADNYIHVL